MSRPVVSSLARTLLAGCTSLIAATVLLVTAPGPADAAVTHQYGYQATVLGFTSWYGSYGMGPLGLAWCIDHGIRAPDPVYRYVAADMSSVPLEARTAMAWVVGRWGNGNDRTTHAALMLVLHDLMGARYPRGRLDVDQLTPAELAGFEGRESEVLARARMMKADGTAHRGLRGALYLTLQLAPLDSDGDTVVRLTVRDDAGQAVPGVPIVLDGAGAGLHTTQATTDASGNASVLAHPSTTTSRVRAQTIVPVLDLEVWRASTTAAQRVTRAIVVGLVAEATVTATPPSTTTTTTTTVPVTTTTTTLPTTTTTVPASTTTTTETPTTTTTTTPPPSSTTTMPTTSTTAPPVAGLGEPPTAPLTTLPRTGLDALTWALYGLGLVLIGSTFVDHRSRWVGRLLSIGHHGHRGYRQHR